MFRLHLDRNADESLVQQARQQIVSALHLGRLKAGDRLPSVRSLSRTWSIDPKTAFRIYHALAAEGYVHLRPGSGAYLKEVAPSLLDQARALALLRLVRKHVTVAEEMEITPQRYAELVGRFTERPVAGSDGGERIVFVECNPEQMNVIADELARRLRVITSSVLLPSLLTGEPRTLAVARASRYVVTTDYHFSEVEPVAKRLGKRLLCVRLDASFLESMLALASRGILGMVVTDTTFLPRFRKSIARLGLDPHATRRIEAVAGADRDGLRSLIARADALYVSPLCASDVKGLIPPTMSVLQPRTHLSTESVESIEASLLFGEPGAPPAERSVRRPSVLDGRVPPAHGPGAEKGGGASQRVGGTAKNGSRAGGSERAGETTASGSRARTRRRPSGRRASRS